MLKAAWPECVSKGNESNRAIVTSEIISIAKEIGGEGFDDFGEHDIEELLVDEALNDDDIFGNGAGGARRLRRMQTKEGGSPPGSGPGRWFVIDKGFGDLY
ncbi:hypothetical protein TNCV_104551 [Trichonephila clavipes]|nr:hypothetical protein TNCV_104551 [Trichonephila clavipes]